MKINKKDVFDTVFAQCCECGKDIFLRDVTELNIVSVFENTEPVVEQHAHKKCFAKSQDSNENNAPINGRATNG